MSVTPLLAFLEGPELIIILVILLVLFGGAKLPQLARSVGTAQREFKKGIAGDDDDVKTVDNATGNVNATTQTNQNTTATDADDKS